MGSRFTAMACSDVCGTLLGTQLWEHSLCLGLMLLGRVFLRHSALILDVLLDPLEASGRTPDIYVTHSGNLSRNYTINSGKEETHLCDKNTNSFGTCILH